MKKLIYIAIALLLLSCANNAKEASVSDMDFSEAEVSKNSSMGLEETAIVANTQLAEAKLKDYFELVVLEQKHPDFKEDIRLQLRGLSEADLNLRDSVNIISIENIRQNGAVRELSDSLQKIHFYFDLITENGTRPDSITAVLRSQKVTVEQQEVRSTKVTFEKN